MTTMTKTKHRTCRAFIKSVNMETREVEQIVSVFENVDLGRDRVKTGAFTATLDEWASSGDPIPTIWSHAWDDPFAHIGFVVEAKELLAGDPLLPEEIADLGGLYTRYKVDERPFADQVLHLLNTRRVREASFAYDVVKQRVGADGVTDLIELDLIEVGPTLKGMNQLTQLLSRKNLAAAIIEELGLKADDTETEEAVGRALEKTAGEGLAEAGSKAWVTLNGSMEETQEAAYSAAFDWARGEGLGNGGFYTAYLEATFDDHVVILVEGWDDPIGEGVYYELNYSIDSDGMAVVEEGKLVEIEATTVAKSRAMKHLNRPGSAKATGDGVTVAGEPSTGKSKTKPETGNGKGQGSEARTDSGVNESDGGDPAIVEIELAELDLTT